MKHIKLFEKFILNEGSFDDSVLQDTWQVDDEDLPAAKIKATKIENDIKTAVHNALGIDKTSETWGDCTFNIQFEYNGEKLAIGLGGTGSFDDDFSGNVCLGIWSEDEEAYGCPEKWGYVPTKQIESELKKYKENPEKYRKLAKESGGFFGENYD